jgi:succinate-semialdehyde dehydrogenase/glutarate-semialdehyde dehydrogenase
MRRVQESEERTALSGVARTLLIGGQWVDAADGKVFEVEDPSTEQVLCRVADAGVADGAAAMAAADGAQSRWSLCPPAVRRDILCRTAELLHQRLEQFAMIMTLEMGKPLAESRNEVHYAADFFRWFAEEATRIAGTYQVAPDGRSRTIVTNVPVGPCLVITPWNFPLAMGARKIAPALAAGCTVIVKPAEETPLSMLALGALLKEAGVPDGVVNVLPSARPVELTEPLLHDRRLKKLSFTGSTAVGKALLAKAAQGVLRTSMATPCSSFARTPTSMQRWRAPSQRRCVTAGRHALRQIVSSSTAASWRISACDWPRA